MFTLNELFFLESKENTIMNGTFVKMIYSTPFFILTNLFLEFPIYNEIYNGNQYLLINTTEHAKLISKICQIEIDILNQYIIMNQDDRPDLVNKSVIYSIHKQLKHGVFKYYQYSKTKHHPKYYIKISGIWETATELGLTFKIIQQ